MPRPRRPAGNEGIQALHPMDLAEFHQPVQRPVDLQWRAKAFVPKPVEYGISAKWPFRLYQCVMDKILVAGQRMCASTHVGFLLRIIGSRPARNRTSAATTMLGPEGVSQRNEPNRPAITAAAPARAAMTAILSGVPANRRAVAAGMMRSAVMSRTPTIFMAMAIIEASSKRKTSSARPVLIPSASAISRLTVAANRVRQIRNRATSTTAPPA